MEQPVASATAPTAAKRKSRPTKQCAEAYCFILSLSWNDIVVNGGKMSTKQQEELIKVKAAQWVPELRKSTIGTSLQYNWYGTRSLRRKSLPSRDKIDGPPSIAARRFTNRPYVDCQ